MGRHQKKIGQYLSVRLYEKERLAVGYGRSIILLSIISVERYGLNLVRYQSIKPKVKLFSR
jgi:hypothetical protein